MNKPRHKANSDASLNRRFAPQFAAASAVTYPAPPVAARRRAATWRWISVNTCLELASSASQSRRGRQAVWRPCGVTAITSTHLESVYVDTTNCTVHLLPPGCSPVPSAIKGHSPPSDAPIAPGALPWPPPRRPSTPNFNGRAGFNRTPAPSSSGHHRCTCTGKHVQNLCVVNLPRRGASDAAAPASPDQHTADDEAARAVPCPPLRPKPHSAAPPPVGSAGGRLLRGAKLYEIGAGTSEIRRMLIGRELFEETK